VSPSRTLPALLLALLVCLVAPSAAQAACAGAGVAPTPGNLGTVRAAVLCLHNQERAAHGMGKLRENARLRRAAAGHSRAMVARGFFNHVAPGGVSMTDRIRRAGYIRGARSWTVGENLGWGTGTLATAREIHVAWMRSPGHKANILRRGFREIGIGIEPAAPLAAEPGATYTANFGTRG